MLRIWACLLLAASLSACSITPPSSMFASLTGDDDQEQAAQAQRVANPAQPRDQQHASMGSSLGNIWDSVKSGLSLGGSDKKQASASASASSTGGIPFNPAQAEKLINDYRVQKGLKPVKLNAKLTEAAFNHSKDMAKSDHISHFDADGADAWERVQRTGYSARLAAENVATGQRSLDEVFNGWQHSRSHNANLLLSDAEEIGIAMVYNPSTQFKTFWTLVLGAQD
ncbi:MAG: CAP domain-containing protein [Alphaproteobacteria bacterium]